MNDDYRMKQIRWRRGANDKYFNHFDTKEEAFECLKEIARRYRHSGLHTNTIKSLTDEYAEKGIKIHAPQLSQWLKDVFRLEVKYAGPGPGKEKKVTTMRMDKDVWRIKNALAMQESGQLSNHWFNAYLRVACNLPTDEVFCFVDDGLGRTLVGFIYWKKELRSIYFGEVEQGTRKLLQLLCEEGEQHGLDHVKTKLKALGFFVI